MQLAQERREVLPATNHDRDPLARCPFGNVKTQTSAYLHSREGESSYHDSVAVPPSRLQMASQISLLPVPFTMGPSTGARAC